MENKKVFKEVNNYTKYKLVQMLIEKYKDKKIDNMNFIEELSDDILKVLAIAGMKYYNELRGEFDENRDGL